MKFAKKIHSIICDDVREEVKNKYSFMGVYGKDIIFNKIPAILPKLVIIIMIEEVREKFNELTLTLKMPKAEPQVLRRTFSKDINVGASFNFIAAFSPFRVEVAGEARFELRIADSKQTNYVHLLGLKQQSKS